MTDAMTLLMKIRQLMNMSGNEEEKYLIIRAYLFTELGESIDDYDRNYYLKRALAYLQEDTSPNDNAEEMS